MEQVVAERGAVTAILNAALANAVARVAEPSARRVAGLGRDEVVDVPAWRMSRRDGRARRRLEGLYRGHVGEAVRREEVDGRANRH